MSDSFHHYSDAAKSGPPSGGYEWAHLFWGYPVPPVSDGSMNFLIWDLIKRRNPKDLLICKYFKESFEIAKDSGCPVIAIDQSLESYSPSFLTRLGWHLNPSRAPRTLISPFVEEAAKAVRKSGCRKVVLWSAMKRLPELRAALPDCTIAFAQRHFDYPSTWAYYKDCDLLITQTRGQTKFAFDRHRWVTPFCVSIPNGAELDEFRPAEKDGEKALRQSLGIPENALVVMFPSKLAQHKGSRHLQRMIKICAQDPSLFFLVVGSLHRGLPAAHRRELKKTLTEGENVLWKNKIPRSEMPDLYRAADICWMPCLWREGFSMAATEALASGVPVIAPPLRLLSRGRIRRLQRFSVRPGRPDGGLPVHFPQTAGRCGPSGPDVGQFQELCRGQALPQKGFGQFRLLPGRPPGGYRRGSEPARLSFPPANSAI